MATDHSSDPFSEEEVQKCLNKLKESANGKDGVTATQFKTIPTQELARYLNTMLITALQILYASSLLYHSLLVYTFTWSIVYPCFKPDSDQAAGLLPTICLLY